MIEGYSSWLENRVVSRFDAAIAEGNYAQQAQVVAIMTELDKEKSIAKVCHTPACAWVVFRIRPRHWLCCPQEWSVPKPGQQSCLGAELCAGWFR